MLAAAARVVVVVVVVVEMRAVAVAAKAHVVTQVMAAAVLVAVVVASKPLVHKAHGHLKVADVAPWATHNPAAMKVVLPVAHPSRAHHARRPVVSPTRCAPASI